MDQKRAEPDRAQRALIGAGLFSLPGTRDAFALVLGAAGLSLLASAVRGFCPLHSNVAATGSR